METSVSAQKRFTKFLPYLLIVAGVIGLAMSFILTLEEHSLLKNPNYVPSCNLNPVIACGSVIRSGQAQAFHFPNPYIGLAAFPVLIVTGIALLAGARLKRWYWLGLEAGTLFGVGFVHWLFWQSVYHIHALCPYCMMVWAVTITTFWYVTLYNLEAGHIKVKEELQKTKNFLLRHHLDILTLWFVVITVLILKHFWYYYGHYF